LELKLCEVRILSVLFSANPPGGEQGIAQGGYLFLGELINQLSLFLIKKGKNIVTAQNSFLSKEVLLGPCVCVCVSLLFLSLPYSGIY
jgi:hypothetical protein